VRRVQHVEKEADTDAVPYEQITRALAAAKEEAVQNLYSVFGFSTKTDAPETFVRSTGLTSDLTVFVARKRHPTTSRGLLAPQISLRILYNSLLFTSARISCIIEQLSILIRKVGANPLARLARLRFDSTTPRKSTRSDCRFRLVWMEGRHY